MAREGEANTREGKQLFKLKENVSRKSGDGLVTNTFRLKIKVSLIIRGVRVWSSLLPGLVGIKYLISFKMELDQFWAAII